MERHQPSYTKLQRSSSSCLTATATATITNRSMKVLSKPTTKLSSLLLIKAAKKSSESLSQGLERSTQKKLSQILRTEAAIEAIERKANSNKHNRLWPKAVLDALDVAIRANRWESALKIFALLRKQHWYKPRCQTYTKLLVMLGKCRQPNQATLIFDIMRSDGLQPTIDVYTALVSAYGLSGLLDKALKTVDDMKVIPDCVPDGYTYSILINCCTKIRRFDTIGRILSEMSHLGIECSIVTYNTIIDGYGKAKLFESMENTLTDMIESETCLPDVYTFNSVVGAYGNCGLIEKMENWFDEFQLMGLRPNVMTFNILIKSYGKAGMHDKMGFVFEFMMKRFISPTIVTFNIIIETFGKVGNIEKMDEVFLKMKRQGMKPNAITYCSLVSAYSKAGLMKKVDSVMRQVENSDVVVDTPFFNCIISAYGLAGNVERMGEMFLEMKERRCKPDNTTFATMIRAYNAVGMVEAAQSLEGKKITTVQSSASCSRNLAPNSSTAVGFDERMLLHSEIEMKSLPHPERPDRLRAIAASLATAGIFPGRCHPILAREITREELEMVQSVENIESVELTSHAIASYFTPDTYANKHSACAARLAAGLCADLSSAIFSGRVKNGFAVVRPPGHHAGVNQAMGFCLHNNAAVAASAALVAGAKKVLIVDWDVHDGNGTQEIFEKNKSESATGVGTFSYALLYKLDIGELKRSFHMPGRSILKKMVSQKGKVLYISLHRHED